MAQRLVYDCAVIGGGPGGLISALYLRRVKRSAVVITTGDPRASWIPRIRNLIGYSDGLRGSELLSKLHDQVVKKHNTEVVNAKAKVVGPVRGGFEIAAGNERIFARKIILATGVEDVHPPVGNVRELCQKGLLGYCPICDGFEHSDQKIALLTSGSYGLKKLKFFSHISKNLVPIVLDQNYRLAPWMTKLVKDLNLRVHQGALESLEENKGGKGLTIKLKGKRPLPADVAYVMLGARVRDEAFRHLKDLKRTRDGYIVATSHLETSIPGIYAVGDCVHALSQVSVAIGHAAIAATKVHNDLGY